MIQERTLDCVMPGQVTGDLDEEYSSGLFSPCSSMLSSNAGDARKAPADAWNVQSEQSSLPSPGQHSSPLQSRRSSCESQLDVTAKFHEERDVVVEQLRRQLDVLFQRQAARIKQMHPVGVRKRCSIGPMSSLSNNPPSPPKNHSPAPPVPPAKRDSVIFQSSSTVGTTGSRQGSSTVNLFAGFMAPPEHLNDSLHSQDRHATSDKNPPPHKPERQKSPPRATPKVDHDVVDRSLQKQNTLMINGDESKKKPRISFSEEISIVKQSSLTGSLTETTEEADDDGDFEKRFMTHRSSVDTTDPQLRKPQRGLSFASEDGSDQSSGRSESERNHDKGRSRRGLQGTTMRFSDIEDDRRRKSIACHAVDVEHLMKAARVQESRLCLFTKSRGFEACAAILLCSNIILLGWQVEVQANRLAQDDLAHFKTINTVYCLVFLGELALRLHAYGCMNYLFGHDYMWSWLDLIVVFMQVIETVTAFAISKSSGGTLSFVGRVVRIARIARVVRAIRIMRFLRGFKVLIDAIYGTMKSCVWALLLLAIIIFVFSIVFAQFTSHFLAKQENPREDFDRLDFYFGNFTSSIFTLFKSIVGGFDWELAAIELTTVDPIFVSLFIVYIILMQFVVINVIAGLFLQSAIEQAQSDQDHVIQLRLRDKKHYVDKLTSLFTQLDSSNDGLISLGEFEQHLKDENVQAFFSGLEIENTDAWTIFKLLDVDGGGSVDFTEFVEGCIRLRGTAKSIEIAQLMYHHKWIMDKVCELANFLHDVYNDPRGSQELGELEGPDALSSLDLGSLVPHLDDE